MLVLSRRDGEEIAIGNNVKIKVLSSVRGRVRIGIEAPRNVPVTRTELPPKFDRRQFAEFGSLTGAEPILPLLAGIAH
ncbi:MAG TPA: carbon storage regulator [Pirellulales bacterium]|jgi:carbon storage regulator|nr:carbon storage regulator [Pirellulales bacterium]